ncbi:hypothetical protein MCEMSEM22_03269 [Comamonadaceae bacterium]
MDLIFSQMLRSELDVNILYLYNATQTYTNAVFEHLDAFRHFSEHRVFFMHSPPDCEFSVDLSLFDAVCVHFSIRLPYDQLSASTIAALNEFKGLKFLFIQDEYDYTHRAWHWIGVVGFQLVFTVVPEHNIESVYPPERFLNIRFQTNLTGYVPNDLIKDVAILPPSQRKVIVGYRGRPLPARYGALGFEKIKIGAMVRDYCKRNGISSDIAWTEDARIYGPAWYSFMTSCRAMLGSESGSNVFDWDGQLDTQIAEHRRHNPLASDVEIYNEIVRLHEIDGIMNQISPRVFEAIAARTVLVLFEGEYSGVVRPEEHFIPLKKDGSNLPEVFAKLNDARYVDEMAERAFRDIIGSGSYSYSAFVEMIDGHIKSLFDTLSFGRVAMGRPMSSSTEADVRPSQFTTMPIRAVALKNRSLVEWDGTLKFVVPVSQIWGRVPESARVWLRPMAHRIKRALFSGEH